MKAILLFYLKLFLVFGLLGFLPALMNLTGKHEFDIIRFMTQACLFGILMALILGTMQIITQKKAGVGSFTQENLAIKQRRIVLSNLNFPQLLERLKSDPTMQKIELTEDNATLLIKNGVSWSSWGEKIMIRVLHESTDNTEYEISSAPRLRTTLFDNGKNFQNVMRIEKLLQSVV